MMVLYHFKESGSDKIWGWIKTFDGALSFWGRTRGSLTFKHYDRLWAAEDQATKKHIKGYRLVTNYKKEVGPEGIWTISPDALELLPEDWIDIYILAKLGMTKF